jgi:uncharacterized protein (DUF2267 family)
MRARDVYSRVAVEADLDTVEQARCATAAVLHALRDRLTPDEARQAAAQLPRELKELWAADASALSWPVRLHRREFLERIRVDADLHSVGQAAVVADAVFGALKDQISVGEAADIMAQLPRDLKTLWARA